MGGGGKGGPGDIFWFYMGYEESSYDSVHFFSHYKFSHPFPAPKIASNFHSQVSPFVVLKKRCG